MAAGEKSAAGTRGKKAGWVGEERAWLKKTSGEEEHQAWPEDEDRDKDRGSGGDQNGTRRNIFGPADLRVLLRRNDVADRFEGCVDGFETPNESDSQDYDEPFGSVYIEEEAEAKDDDRRERVDPSIRLSSEHETETTEGGSKTRRSG